MSGEQGVAAIAAGLTEPQRRALTAAELDGHLNRYFARWLDLPTGRGLVKSGLGTAVWSGVVLSTSGEAVRAHLLSDTPTQVNEGDR